jgi:hypothetical protein
MPETKYLTVVMYPRIVADSDTTKQALTPSENLDVT